MCKQCDEAASPRRPEADELNTIRGTALACVLGAVLWVVFIAWVFS